MDEIRARAVLDAVGRAVPGSVLLWRGDDLRGSDIDVVVLEGHDAALWRVLRDAGLTSAPQDPGHMLWRLLPGETVVVDVLSAHGWPAMYPPLAEVVARSVSRPDGLLAASAEDRLLIHAAEAVAGWPLDKVLRKVRPVLAEHPGPDAPGLAALVRDPDRLEARAPEGRLGLAAALRAGARSSTGRAALRVRAADRLGIPTRPPLPSPAPGVARHNGVVIALSGMDGAGKSTAALEIAETLEQAGRPAIVFWTRLAGDPYLLDLVARPVRRVLGKAPRAAEPGADKPGAAPAQPSTRSGPVEAVWVALVAAESVRVARRAFRLRRRGLSVVCDRWAADAIVDVRVRYGRHAVAEWLLRHGFPDPDLSLLLDVDAATAAARKPGDQRPEVLEVMAGLYRSHARDMVRVDASADRAVVAERVRAALRRALPAA